MHPQKLGKYAIERFVGGGMSHVYRATDTQANRLVALKLMTESALANPEARARFLAEGQLMRGLQHPNIIRTYESGEIDGQPFIAMEWLEGESLRAAVAGGRAGDVPRRVAVAQQIAEALGYLHARGVLHRDLKPENIHVDRAGMARLMDFGIAGVVGAAASLPGATAGTPYYMSPEQVLGQPLTAQADIYSFGVLLYELFTGIKPFNGSSVNEIFEQVLFKPIDPAPLAKLTAAVRAVIVACTNKKLMERPLEMAPVIEALKEAIVTVPEPAPAPVQAQATTEFVASEPGKLSPSTSRPESTVRLKMPPPPSGMAAVAMSAPVAAGAQEVPQQSPWMLAMVGAAGVALLLYLVTTFTAR